MTMPVLTRSLLAEKSDLVEHLKSLGR